ncbi:hypothetical protein ACIQVT_34495 [Streptomyces sp. NPDC100445]|uniref:hypothetical protein n=1 Tax=Streptomyces sp. NPDC100445 TaxID=3366102 RepID=UPI00380765E5
MSFEHLIKNPPIITREHISDLLHALRYRADIALAVDVKGGLHVTSAELLDRKAYRIVLRGDAVRPMLATVTKHVERNFQDYYTPTHTGALLIARIAQVRMLAVVAEVMSDAE